MLFPIFLEYVQGDSIEERPCGDEEHLMPRCPTPPLPTSTTLAANDSPEVEYPLKHEEGGDRRGRWSSDSRHFEERNKGIPTSGEYNLKTVLPN